MQRTVQAEVISSTFDEPANRHVQVADMARDAGVRIDAIATAGLRFSGLSPDRNLVEFVELPRDVHPYYIATQAHPELRSRPTDPHPLFRGLIGAALERHRSSELFDVDDE